MAVERTLSIIKPDAVAKNVIGKIISRFEDAGLRVVAAKMVQLSQSDAEGFYAEHKERPFFKDLVGFMTSGPVVVQVLEGEKDMVEKTYSRVAKDTRHSALIRVLERNREERSFPDWTMGFEKVFHGDPGGDILPVDAGDLTKNPNVELLRKQAPEIISFMRSLYASRNMRGAPDLERRA